MALNFLDWETCELMKVSYALPDLETAIKQGEETLLEAKHKVYNAVIYNSIDAHANAIQLLVDVATASFTAVDDGRRLSKRQNVFIADVHQKEMELSRMIFPDTSENAMVCIQGPLLLSLLIFLASSRVHPMKNFLKKKGQLKNYGCRGAFLRELVVLSEEFEIESRVKEHWTSYRKVFQDGNVVFNARSQILREAPGTKISVTNLFRKLPVRRTDLFRNQKHKSRVVKNILNFCLSMSMIWPSLSIDVHYKGMCVQPVAIYAVKTCRERLLEHFGHQLGNKLQYVDFSSKASPFSIRGYIALIPEEPKALGPGIKQAKSYYQFVFLANESIKECHRVCSRVITRAAVKILSAIPIFVLKIEAPRDTYDDFGGGVTDGVLFKKPKEITEFLFEFIKSLIKTDPILSKSEFQVLSKPCENVSPDKTMAPDSEEDSIKTFNRFQDSNCATQYWRNAIRPTIPRYCSQVNDIDLDYFNEDEGCPPSIQGHCELAAPCQLQRNLVQTPSICHGCGRAADLSRAVHSYEEIYFPSKALSPLLKPSPPADVKSNSAPWLSSKADTYDCADALLDLCQENCIAESTYQIDDACKPGACKQENRLVVADEDQFCRELIPLNSSALHQINTKSDYFSSDRPASCFEKHWGGRNHNSEKRITGALHIDTADNFKYQEIKIKKSTVEMLQVIRQVDRKFILVQADTTRGKLVLCIDQHAADERIRLEKLEDDIFGPDGTFRRVQIQVHDPPIVLQMYLRERETLQHNKDLVESWGFSYEPVAPRPGLFFNIGEKTCPDETITILLYTTPMVEMRAANADDFREYIQLLHSAGESYQISHIRPPVITRLLNSRACRGAVMFGDYLSLGQCRDLIEDLKTCQLPFQCAHGRPSVVPIAKIHNIGF
ncbi:hypothetical protein CCR75_007717 [Bremia lactucae]|uniref:MutL C-terminal dimerisation domain-containing protein n=1 Tax=Bremia lactucae TaxID=4779 RepID=A0A976IK68_BRELC|nr:hypothetical protein CCR75_007717 [Bremia lactucae]